ncbi:MAG: hypothetical protein HY301_05485 [Verrucomicrobia bacterium]|nr:hypothetical protein [Verrucomicrobiota bacterium]
MKTFCFLARLVTLGALLAAAGCTSTPEQIRSGAIAAVEIRGCDQERLLNAVRAAFDADGFKPKSKSDPLVFEKPGGFVNGLVFGAWDTVTVRVKVKVDGMDEGPWLVAADVFMVQSAGQTVFEEESKMGTTHRSACQRVLDDVKRRAEMPDAPK